MTTPPPISRYERFRKRRAELATEVDAHRLKAVGLGASLGCAIWFGVQYFSGLDNFGYSIGTIYFALLYATGIAIGWLGGTHALEASFALVMIQLPAYLLYPNPDGELGNLFPIVAAMLVIGALPAVGLTFVAGFVRRKLASRAEAK